MKHPRISTPNYVNAQGGLAALRAATGSGAAAAVLAVLPYEWERVLAGGGPAPLLSRLVPPSLIQLSDDAETSGGLTSSIGPAPSSLS